MSAAAIRPRPPARAGPPTRATTGFGRLPDRGEHLAHPAGRHVTGGERGGGLLQVGPGAEDRPGVAQHDHPYRGSSATAVASAATSSSISADGERVAVGRAVQGERRHAARRRSVRTSVGHAGTLRHRRAGQTGDMPSTLPDGDPAPADGRLPGLGADARLGRDGLRASTCTYRSAPAGAGTATSTPTPRPSWAGARTQESYAGHRAGGGRPGRAGARRRRAAGEHRLLRRRHADPAGRRTTLAGSWTALDEAFGLAADAEVTTEANPESVDPASLRRAARRPASPGSRSACSRPRRTCWRCWTAGTPRAGPPPRRAEAREAGFEHVNLDLIYGTPGETAEDFAGLAGRGGRRRASTTSRRTR